MQTKNKTASATNDFVAMSLKLASPERIREWSFGEVTKPETINYRTQRSERGGLFDERIFGPEKDFECYCGKYRRVRYKDVVCEKCGVEVTRSIVRRERMGHIELASPVAHIWFVKSVPSRMAMMMGVGAGDLEKVIYFAGYIITKIHDDEKKNILEALDQEFKTKVKACNNEEEKEKIRTSLSEVKKEIAYLREGVVLDETAYHKFSLKYGSLFEAEIGGEAIYRLLKNVNLESLATELSADLEKSSAAARPKILKRLNLVTSMLKAGVRPEWMFLRAIPVIPPAIRPMVALDGGRHATSDLNDLYRRVINRNNRLLKLKEIGAPEVIQRNEKRILQEAVDALIDNSIRRGTENSAMSTAQRRPLKSLADILRGKQGRFRQNLLGKRVDYSGRSVIVVGPSLHLDQCGLPKHMALELFRPFIVNKLLERELAYNIRGAGKLIEEGIPEVWEILEEVTKDKFVLLNRAPTLHRLGIQAFRPVLIEGNAIQIHPLVCSAFNADFDGDQMAVHVPLGERAQEEARTLMCSARNLLKPGSGDPIVVPKLDIVLGCFWMTKAVDGERGEGMYFESPNAAILSYDFGEVGFRAKIKVRGTEKVKYSQFNGELFETSVGRILFNSVLPSDYPFINREITLRELQSLIEDLLAKYGTDAMGEILDKVKDFGYKYVTKSGITWSIADLKIPDEKAGWVEEARKQVDNIEENYTMGFISKGERYRMVIEIWKGVNDKIEKALPATLDKNGGISDMLVSKARGSTSNLCQMAGMKGLILKPNGSIIDFPIVPSYKEGLSPLEYFVTTHGARKGTADTALNTAKAGYLTRKLVDVSQAIVISEVDCGDKEGRLIKKAALLGFDKSMMTACRGRIVAQTIKDAEGNIVFAKGHLLSRADAQKIDEKGIVEAYVRSPLTCKTRRGLCQQCYGLDLGRNKLIDMGEAVGIIAAQSIGEPATQLTMRTFHAGGVAGEAGDITMGLPRVEEIFERRTPRACAILATVDGTIVSIAEENGEKRITLMPNVGEGNKKRESVVFEVPFARNIIIKEGSEVKKGDFLTDGSANLSELFLYAGKTALEDYVLNETNRIYGIQGATIARKHIELVIRQMTSRRKITDAGDTNFVVGDVVEAANLETANEKALKAGGEIAKGQTMVQGITEVSLSTESFLSAASFQNTSRVLIETAVKGGIDYLRGLKENVIVGRVIPAGTGLRDRGSRPIEKGTFDELVG